MALLDYPDTDLVIACLQDAQAKVQSVAELEKRSLLVFDDMDAMDQLAALKRWPAAVVQYEGMRSEAENKVTDKIGASVLLYVSVMVINQGETLIKTDTKIPTLLLLTQLRRKFLNKKAPSGHKWKFMLEAAADSKSGLTFWVQRWQVPLQLQVNSEA
jgi:hypothetical protein